MLKRQKILDLVCEVPPGYVASYGMIASLLPGTIPRHVGFALSQLPEDTNVPWHRIIRTSGEIAPRPHADVQKRLLGAEGVSFDAKGFVCMGRHKWQGPGPEWLEDCHMGIAEALAVMVKW